MFLGLSIGANILAARYFGAHEDEELSKTVHTSILLSLYSGVFLTVVGILGARTILIWMQCPANVLDLATLYLRIYFAGMTATMLYNFGAALLRASGDTQRPLYYLFASGVVNVILNLVFVIYFHMDVAGVALATVISQCLSAAFVLFFLMLGAVGAIEQDIVPLFPGMVRVFALMALWVLFCNLAGAFDYTEPERRKPREVRREDPVARTGRTSRQSPCPSGRAKNYR